MFVESSDDDDVECSPSMTLLLSRAKPPDGHTPQSSIGKPQGGSKANHKVTKRNDPSRKGRKRRRIDDDDADINRASTDFDNSGEASAWPDMVEDEVNSYPTGFEAEELEEFKQAKDEEAVKAVIFKLSTDDVHDSETLQNFESALNKIIGTTTGRRQNGEQLSTRDCLVREAWRRMARFCQDRQCYPKSLLYYLKMLELDDTDLSVWQTVYRTAFDLGRYDLCADACKHACRDDNIDPLAVEYLILIYYAVFNYEPCMSLAWRVLQQDPFNLIARVVAQELISEGSFLSYKYGFQWEQFCGRHSVDEVSLKSAHGSVLQQCKTIRQRYFAVENGAVVENAASTVFGKLEIELPPDIVATISPRSDLAQLGHFLLSIENLIPTGNCADMITITNGFNDSERFAREIVVLNGAGRASDGIVEKNASFTSTDQMQVDIPQVLITDSQGLPSNAVKLADLAVSQSLEVVSEIAPAQVTLSTNSVGNITGSVDGSQIIGKQRQSSRQRYKNLPSNEVLSAFCRLFQRLEPPATWIENDESAEDNNDNTFAHESPIVHPLLPLAHKNVVHPERASLLSTTDSIHAAQLILDSECEISGKKVTLLWHRILQTFCMACADIADRQWPERLIEVYKQLYLRLRRTSYRVPDVELLLPDDYQNCDAELKRQNYLQHCRLILSANELLVDDLLKWKHHALKQLSRLEFYQQKILRTIEFLPFFNKDKKFMEQLCTLNASQLFGMPNSSLDDDLEASKLEGWRLFFRILYLCARHAEYFAVESTDFDSNVDLKTSSFLEIEKYLNSALAMLESVQQRLESQNCRVIVANCQQILPRASPLILSVQSLRAQLDELCATQTTLTMSTSWRTRSFEEYVKLFCKRYKLDGLDDACDLAFLAQTVSDADSSAHHDVWRLIESLSASSDTSESSTELIRLLEAWLYVYVTTKLDAIEKASVDSSKGVADFLQWKSDVFQIFQLLYERIDLRQENLYAHEALQIAFGGNVDRLLRRLARSVYEAMLAVFARTPENSDSGGLPTTPFIILAVILRILPDSNNPLQGRLVDNELTAYFKEDSTEKNAPIFCQFLYYTHAFLAGTLHSCVQQGETTNTEQFLPFSIETLRLFVTQINALIAETADDAEKRHLIHIRDEAVDELDQAFYCLYRYRRSKKSRFDEHIGSKTAQNELSLSICYDLYQHFLPPTLPIPDGHRQETINSDQKDVFMRILQVLNESGFDADKIYSNCSTYLLTPSELRQIEIGMQADFDEVSSLHAQRVEDCSRTHGKRSQTRRAAAIAEHLYYCLADWHFKFEWYDQAHELYRVDLRRNPRRAQSWVGLAMTTRAMGGNDMKTTEFDFTSLREYDQCEEALNYFRIALLRFGDDVGREESMWIEMGLMAYEMQTCLSWRVKMAKETESDRVSARLEDEGNKSEPVNESKSDQIHLETNERESDKVPTLHNISLCSIENDDEIEYLSTFPPADTKTAVDYLVSPLLPADGVVSLERYMMYSGMALPALYFVSNRENRSLIPKTSLSPLDVSDGDPALQKRCIKRRRQLLLVCLYAFVQGEHCCEEPNEHWLHHYMMGKCCEKLRPMQPERYLLQYAFSLEALDKIQKCVYPTQTTWSNWNKLGADMNAIELYYRIHASALKFLTVYARRQRDDGNAPQPVFEEPIKFLQCLLDDLSKCPFIANAGSSQNKPTVAPTTAISTGGGRKRRERSAQTAANFGAEQWAVHTQLLAAKFLSHVRNASSVAGTSAENSARPRRQNLIQQCVRGIHIVLERCPWHYKALNRLAFLYADYAPMANEDQVRAMLIGGGGGASQTSNSTSVIANWKPPRGLFQDRRPTNYFNGVWQLPDDEIQRCFTFSNHLYRAASLLMRVLRRDGESQMLLQMALQFGKPNSKHSYLRDADYVTLSQRACRLAFGTLNEQLAMYVNVSSSAQQQIAPDTRAAFVRNVWKCYKTLKDSKLKVPKLAEHVLVDVFERIEQQNLPPGKDRYGSANVKSAQRYFNTTFGNPNQLAKSASTRKRETGKNLGETTDNNKSSASLAEMSSQEDASTGDEGEDLEVLPTAVAGLEMLTQSSSLVSAAATNASGSNVPSPAVAGNKHVLSPGDLADLEQLLDSEDMREFL